MALFRAEPSSPPPPALPAASSSPVRVTASQALWSPDTPEYVPRFTCIYGDDDAKPELDGEEMQHKQSGEAVSRLRGAAEGKLPEISGGGDTSAQKPTGYGSSSFAPLAGRRPAS